jgi:molybdate transport system substrate-binding protein
MNDVTILSGGAAHGLVRALSPAFEQQHGCRIAGEFGAVGAMRGKLEGGQPTDMLILTRSIIEDLTKAGLVDGDTVRDLGRVASSLAVRAGEAIPDIETAEDLKRRLLAADEIYFPDPALATAGIHFANVLSKLGIADAVNSRIRVFPNGATAMRHLGQSTAPSAIGSTQVTEILAEEGVSLVGPLPPGCELVTVYTAAVCTGARAPDLARALIERLTADETVEQRQLAGFA